MADSSTYTEGRLRDTRDKYFGLTKHSLVISRKLLGF